MNNTSVYVLQVSQNLRICECKRRQHFLDIQFVLLLFATTVSTMSMCRVGRKSLKPLPTILFVFVQKVTLLVLSNCTFQCLIFIAITCVCKACRTTMYRQVRIHFKRWRNRNVFRLLIIGSCQKVFLRKILAYFIFSSEGVSFVWFAL